MSKKGFIYLYAALLAAVVIWQYMAIEASWHSTGKKTSVQLTQGTLTLLDFPSHQPQTKAIILFGSGDGGWGGIEEAISQSLQNYGYEVIGIDFLAYAKSDYDLNILQADFTTIIQTVQASHGGHPPPVILGGWSMGAAQAIAAAGGPKTLPGVVGLLLVDPLGRGRYGLRTSDRLDFLPTGPGTYSMDAFSKTMGQLRVVQWHADEDSIDSRVWLESLTAPHREYDFPNTGHFYETDSANFLRQLAESVNWIVAGGPTEVTSSRKDSR